MRVKTLAVLILLAPTTAIASIHHVDPSGTGDYPTIQAAIDACVLGDTVLCAPGTYAWTGNRNIELPGFDILVLGEGGSEATILDCNSSARGFHIHQGETPATRIEGFTVLDGRELQSEANQGGGVCIEGASPTLRDLCLISCSAMSWAGGLYIFQSPGTVIEDVVIEGGYSWGNGGGIAIVESSPLLVRVQVLENGARDHGGGIYILDSSPVLQSCSIVANCCYDLGAGIAIEGGETTISDCLIAYNGTPGWSGLHGMNEGAGLGIHCSNVFGNRGNNYGGTLSDQTGINGNLSEDPLFCNLSAGDWRLHADSPCLPANNDCGVQMGALGQGCDAPIYLIAGNVHDGEGTGLSEVEISGLQFITLVTGESGDYSCHLPAGWSGTLAPAKTGYLFQPHLRSYENLQADLPGEDFLAIHPSEVFVPENFPTLNEAMDYCEDGDTITVSPGEYSLDYWGEQYLDFQGKAILLRSLLGSEMTVIEYGYPAILFENGEGPDAVVEGFTIRHSSVGILCRNNSSPTLRDLIFEVNSSWPCLGCCGAGLCCEEGASPSVTNVVFRYNSAANGGALYCSGDASPVLFNVIFEGNDGNKGGAVYIHNASPHFTLARFAGNRAMPEYFSEPRFWVDGYGGAIYCHDASPVFEICTFTGNRALYGYYHYGNTYGGAVYIGGSSTPEFLNCTFHGNGVEGPEEHLGGTFYYGSSATPVITNSIVSFSTQGGGIYCAGEGCELGIACSDVYGNIGGDYVGLPNQTGVNGNISAHPLFCDGLAGDFTLAGNSPCLPQGNDCGVIIGAWGEGCDDTPVMLALFTAQPEGNAVVLRWELSDDCGTADFRLSAQHDGITRQLDWWQTSPCHYTARDEDPVLSAGGQIRYLLEGRLSGENWQLLRTAEVELPATHLATSLLMPYPNPFNPRTTIRFTLDSTRRIRITIYNLAGRKVALLADGFFEKGINEIIWAGNDDRGRTLSAGVYFLRMEAESFIEIRKMMYLK